MRSGHDPATAYAETPEVDDFVVIAIRDELLEDRGKLAEFGLARLATRAGGTDAHEHQLTTDRIEFDILREIAAALPELTVAVWRLSHRLNIPGPDAE